MKKIVWMTMLLLVSTLFACTTTTPVETPVDSTPVESTPIETEMDPIEQIFMDSSEMTNYTMTALIYHKSDIYTLIIKVTENHASLDIDGVTEYFTKTNQVCKHYIPTIDGYVIEVIECADQNTMTFAFFEDFQVSWFSEIGGKYYMNLQNHSALTDFFNQTMEGAVVSNFELIIGDDYFEQFLFDIMVGDALYRLDMTFSGVGETTIVLPNIG